MDKIIENHKHYWRHKHSITSLVISVLMLVAGFVATHYSTTYVDAFKGNVVPDLILDLLPTMKVGFVFFELAGLFAIFIIGLLLINPKYFPFVFESSAMFFFTRSMFMMLTHLSAPNIEHYANFGVVVDSGNDLFFSGHAGYPILLMLIYWRNKYLRYLFLAVSIIGSIAVLLGHLHYSIDVFASYFIAYGIYRLSKRLFHYSFSLSQVQ